MKCRKCQGRTPPSFGLEKCVWCSKRTVRDMYELARVDAEGKPVNPPIPGNKRAPRRKGGVG
jgi:hypothetical protein